MLHQKRGISKRDAKTPILVEKKDFSEFGTGTALYIGIRKKERKKDAR